MISSDEDVRETGSGPRYRKLLPLPRPGSGHPAEMEAHGDPQRSLGAPVAWSTRKRPQRASSTLRTGTWQGGRSRNGSSGTRLAPPSRYQPCSRKSRTERRRRLELAEENESGTGAARPLLPRACTRLVRGRAVRWSGGRTEDRGGRRNAGERPTAELGGAADGGKDEGQSLNLQIAGQICKVFNVGRFFSQNVHCAMAESSTPSVRFYLSWRLS